MLAMRCYSQFMAKNNEAGEMTEFGRELWAIVQRRGRFSQAAIGRRIGESTGWTPSRQAINHWLYGTRDVPRDFVPAVVKTFGLTEEEEATLKELYFYGQGDNIKHRFRDGEKGKKDRPLPGGARSPEDLREGLNAAAETREQCRSGEADDQGADTSRGV